MPEFVVFTNGAVTLVCLNAAFTAWTDRTYGPTGNVDVAIEYVPPNGIVTC